MFNTKEQEIIKWGVDNGKSKEEITKAITNYRLGITSIESQPTQSEQPKEPNYLQRVGSSIVSDVNTRADKTRVILGRKDTGIIEKGTQLFGQGAGAAANVIESTINEIPVVKKIINAMGAGINWLTTLSPIKYLGDKLGNSKTLQEVVTLYDTDPNFKDTVDAVANIPRLGLDIQVAGQAGKTAKNIAAGSAKFAQKTVGPIVEKTGKLLMGVKKYTASRLPKLLGIFSAESDDVIQYALKDPAAATLGLKQGDVALRKAVEEGATGSIKLRNSFTQGYTVAKEKVLGQYTKTLIPRNNVKGVFNTLLKDNDVQILKDGTLDFTKSKIVANPGEISKINAAYKALWQWDNFTISSLDDYKQLVGQLTKFANEAGGSSKSPLLGKLYYKLNKIAAEKLPKDVATTYLELNNKFSSNIELYNDMVDAFNSGDPFIKLANSLGKNKDTLKQVLDFYEKQSSKSVLPIVAGRELAMEKQAAFGFLNPRSWIDFFIAPEKQGEIILKVGSKLPK